jgi:hypothetical protein
LIVDREREIQGFSTANLLISVSCCFSWFLIEKGSLVELWKLNSIARIKDRKKKLEKLSWRVVKMRHSPLARFQNIRLNVLLLLLLLLLLCNKRQLAS